MQLALRKVIKCLFLFPIISMAFCHFTLAQEQFAQKQSAREQSAQKQFRPEEVKADMKILYQKVLKFHPDPFAYQNAADYSAMFDSAYNNLNSSLSIVEAYEAMLPITGDIKDLHTSIGLPKAWAKAQKKQFPFFIKSIDDKIVIAYNWSADSTITRGYELLSIDDEPMQKLLKRAEMYYSTDNGNEISKRYYAERRLPNVLSRMMVINDSIKVELKPIGTDSVLSKYIKSEEGKNLMKVFKQRYPTQLRQNFDYAILDSLNKIAKLNITTFSEKGGLLNLNQRKFKKKLKARMKQIEADSIQSLVLDFRGNGGGAVINIPRVVSYFAKENFKIMDSMAIKRKAFFKAFPVYQILAPVIGRLYFNKKQGDFFVDYGNKKAKFKPAKKYHFDGDVYIMGDGGSYSATIYTTSLMLENKLATYIGEQGGGTRWGSFAGQWHKGKLPNTKIAFRIPLFRMTHFIPNTRNESLFIQPSHRFDYEWDDFMKFEDSYEKKAIEVILEKREAQN